MAGGYLSKEDCLQFYYYPDENQTYDEDGNLIPLVSKFVTVDEWRYFHDNYSVSYLLCQNRQQPGTYIELIKV